MNINIIQDFMIILSAVYFLEIATMSIARNMGWEKMEWILQWSMVAVMIPITMGMLTLAWENSPLWIILFPALLVLFFLIDSILDSLSIDRPGRIILSYLNIFLLIAGGVGMMLIAFHQGKLTGFLFLLAWAVFGLTLGLSPLLALLRFLLIPLRKKRFIEN